MVERRYSQGFTLIELSIVLVVIGLIVGGILVGQNLIVASQVRATITQVEKFNQAANTFYGKYGFLPGDMPAGPAAQFGFGARGTAPGQGDGNGIIQGYAGSALGGFENAGETVTFWVDLSTARLIEYGFTQGSETSGPGVISPTTSPNLDAFFPAAKIGNGNYFYIWSGDFAGLEDSVPPNYFGLSVPVSIDSGWVIISNPGLTVAQASSIDKKVDDGLPQTGNVLAAYYNFNLNCCGGAWAGGGGVEGAHNGGWTTSRGLPYTGQTQGTSLTCYDNGNVNGATQQYSVEISNGTGVNCALSFRMQAGD
jgi:prepilin-type N-terminal cleavage/methylation domain-containing protein